MCMRQHSQPASATTAAIAGSPRRAVTSLTNAAPAASAARATAAFEVSMLRTAGRSPASASITGTTRRSSSSSPTPWAPGRVDSPPTSTRSAPSAASAWACATASWRPKHSPPSENESGVTLRMPITRKLATRRIVGGRIASGGERWDTGAMATPAAGDPRTVPDPRLPAALLDALPVGVACIDADLRIAYANRAFAEAVGAGTGGDLRSAPGRLAPLAAAARSVLAGSEAQHVLLGADGPDARVLSLDDRHAGVVLRGGGPAGTGSGE